MMGAGEVFAETGDFCDVFVASAALARTINRTDVTQAVVAERDASNFKTVFPFSYAYIAPNV